MGLAELSNSILYSLPIHCLEQLFVACLEYLAQGRMLLGSNSLDFPGS